MRSTNLTSSTIISKFHLLYLGRQLIKPSRQPNIAATRIGKQVLLGGDYLPTPSPCGNNCSYSIEFLGPSYRCEDKIYSDLEILVNSTLTTEIQRMTQLFNRTLFLGAETALLSSDNETILGRRYEMQWKDNALVMDGNQGHVGTGLIPQNLSCVLYEATYHVNISYLNGKQTVLTKVNNGLILNTTNFGNDNAIIPEPPKNAKDGLSVIITNSTMGGAGGTTVLDLFTRSNLMAVKDTFVLPLVGYLGTPGEHPFILLKTYPREVNK
jgi:hypothetical protein